MSVQLGGTLGVTIQGVNFTGVNTKKVYKNTNHDTSLNKIIISPTTNIQGVDPVPVAKKIVILVVGGGGYGGGNEYAGGGGGGGLVVHNFDEGIGATISSIGAANGGNSIAVVSGTTLTANGGAYAGSWAVGQGGNASGGNIANLKGGNSGGSGAGQAGTSLTVGSITYQSAGGGGGFANWGSTAPPGGTGNYTTSFTGKGGNAWSQDGGTATSPGSNYGGGGGGGGNYGRTGSNGAPGVIVVTYSALRQLYSGGTISYNYNFSKQLLDFVHIFTTAGTLTYIPA